MAQKKALSKEEVERRKDHAKILYIRQGVTNQKELAERVGISYQTICKWINADDELWKRMRGSLLVTKEEELRRIYMQITEINDLIFGRPKGQRFSNSKEADILIKLTASAKQLETDTSIGNKMNALMEFINFVKVQDYEKAKEITVLADPFIKSLK